MTDADAQAEMFDANAPVDLSHLDGSFTTAEAATSGTAPPDG